MRLDNTRTRWRWTNDDCGADEKYIPLLYTEELILK